MKKFSGTSVYLFAEFSASLCLGMVFVSMSLYEATVAGLSPIQLVLVGTTLELSAFLFEVPTGVVADVYSRRLSIIVGYFLMGVGLLVEGFLPAFLPIIIAQVIWGLGYTFTSGASQAWITDEIGEESANRLFLRANRYVLFATLIGMALAFFIGGSSAAMPIRVGASGTLLISLILILIMPEFGFKPTPRADRNTWEHMWHTFKEGLSEVRTRPRLGNILWVGFFFGLYSEGFDRLWVKHLIDTFELPLIIGQTQVGFFAIMRISAMLLVILATRFLEKRWDTSNPQLIGRAMVIITAGISAGLVLFALSPILSLAIAVYCMISVFRNVGIPLYQAWVNQKLDSSTRATVFSISSQVDAFGQIGGGPLSAFVAGRFSVIAALLLSGLLLLPALRYIQRTNSLTEQTEPIESEVAGRPDGS